MRRYRLRFDSAPDEFIDAEGSTEAVAKRVTRPALPSGLTDMTALVAFCAPHVYATPLLDRIYGRVTEAVDDDQPLTFTAKELT